MKRAINTTLLRATLVILVSLNLCSVPALAQGGAAKTNTKILYHNGPVMAGTTTVYVIWYGNWSGISPGSSRETQDVVSLFLSTLGSSRYFLINTGYPGANGTAPNGHLLYAGSVSDGHSRGDELNPLAIQGIISDKIFVSQELPLDTAGTYIVIASSDVSANATGFCTPNTPPYHGSFAVEGSTLTYAFIGNPMRCPSSAAPQLTVGQPTPNGNFAADGIASSLATVLSAIVTNPTGYGWFDRYGLENSTKCRVVFGETYVTENGARANMPLMGRDWLIQHNWINNPRKGYCSISVPVP
jgi:hypothetical protein